MIKSIHYQDTVPIIYLAGTLEIGKQAVLKEELLKNVKSKSQKMVLHFGDVEFIDSACLGALIGFLRELRKAGGDIGIVALQDEVYSIFQITRMDKVFRIFDTIEEAIAFCRA